MSKKGLSVNDPSSYSNPEEVIVTNTNIILRVNFDKKTLQGRVILTAKKVDNKATRLILDAKNLNISKIIDEVTSKELPYSLSENFEEFGSKLSITLPSNSDTFFIAIHYESSPNASGLQWLTADQTCGKQHPYMFSQFQAIHARSVLPCQDTPSVKTKYTATITAPAELTVLMSAICKSSKVIGGNLKEFVFSQEVPIPSYLIAIAVGALESRKIGPRSHVWSEKEIIEACAYEFAETEHQLKTAEEICGPYVWGIYDILVLPPSFAYGGMENPCLTFATPTLLAGDRSLANVIAHEITHSWTGNLITNKNFEHFWLNEGFTVFVERKIKGRLTSPLHQDFDAHGRVQELRETIQKLGENNPLTCLVQDLKGVHPDDAFSIVPYEKGQTFLRYLEEVVGGPAKFEPFLRQYFETFKFKSIDSNDFKSFFETYFSSNSNIKSIDWHQWLYSPGMPPVIPNYNTSLAENCNKLAKDVLDWDEKTPCPVNTEHFKNLTADEIIHFLQLLLNGKGLSHTKLDHLEKIFHNVKNAEIKLRWLRLGLQSHWAKSIEPALNWVNEVGRMKFVRPIYRDLYAWEDARAKAIDNFQKNKQCMMHVSAYTVSKDLHLTS